MFRILIPGLAIAAIACTPETARETPPASPTSGWSIAPAGDLNNFFDCLANTEAGLVSAHRGGPSPGYPENAIETMAAILKDTPAIMEIDVATSSDGVLFLMHDDRLERTTTGSGVANALSWDEIRRLRLEDNDGRKTAFAPPRFDDVLAWADSKTILQIDFKRSTSFEAVTDEIRRQRAQDRVILIAYSMAQAQKLHRLLPEAMISLSVSTQSELNSAVAAGVPANRILGFTGTEAPRPRLFSQLADRDVEVIFGTLGGRSSIDRDIEATGNEETYAELASAGVDIIATDRPHAAFAALEAADLAPESGECGISFN